MSFLKDTLMKRVVNGLIKIGDKSVNQSSFVGMYEPKIPEILIRTRIKIYDNRNVEK